MPEILFCAFNRLEYTRASFQALLRNTDWSLVSRLFVIDDGSTDGTREYLEEAIQDVPAERRLVHLGLRSPVEGMNWFLRNTDCEVFAKIDNDVVVPAGWLPTMLDVLERHPLLELLGMEAGMTSCPGRDGELWDGTYDYEPSTHIGGVGLMRRSAFRGRRMRADGRFGWTEYQHIYKPKRGWISPDLPVILLDRLPFEPWVSLGEMYVGRGWQRPWPKWDPQWMEWAYSWFVTEEVAA